MRKVRPSGRGVRPTYRRTASFWSMPDRWPLRAGRNRVLTSERDRSSEPRTPKLIAHDPCDRPNRKVIGMSPVPRRWCMKMAAMKA